MGKIERVTIPYIPRPQFTPFHDRDKRWSVIVAHRRAGKTVACVNDLIRGALMCQRERPRFAYIAPFYKQAKTVAWDYLKHFTAPIPGIEQRESELAVNLPNGGQVRLWGSDNPDALRGMYLDSAVLDEAADMAPRLFPEILRPALSDRQGGCVWIGTPKGLNDFHDVWQTAKGDEEYFTLMLKASETKILPQAELDSARRQMTPEQYAQEYECSFNAAILGSYYGRELEQAEKDGRISEVPADPGVQVETSWDLGVGANNPIWFFQRSGFAIKVIDYSADGADFAEYAKILDRKGYRYKEHFLPFDAGGKNVGMDRTRVQTLNDFGVRPTTIVAKLPVDDGINAVRRILSRCWFDKAKCAEGLKALRQYHREWDSERKVFFERPQHDWCSHPADSFRTFAVGMSDTAPNQAWKKPDLSGII